MHTLKHNEKHGAEAANMVGWANVRAVAAMGWAAGARKEATPQ